MALTTTVDLTAISPAAVVKDLLEAYYSTPTLLQYAETDDSLRGQNAGDKVKIGSFGGATAALNLTETEAIVPKKFTASAREITVGRIGDGYAYSYRAQNASTENLQARATSYLGRAFALRAAINLGAAALASVAGGRTITATGTDAAAVMTPENFIAAVRTFPDELRPGLAAILTPGQRAALTDAVRAGGTSYAGQTVWSDGEIDRFFGIQIRTDQHLPTTTGVRKAALFVVPGRTLVEAPAQDPLIEFTRDPSAASIFAWMNAYWAGGVQDIDTLTVVNAAG